MKYLKKKKMHEIAKNVYGKRMPAMKNCSYKYCGGAEWLEFSISYSNNDDFIVKLGSLCAGAWLHLVERDFDTWEVVRDEILK